MNASSIRRHLRPSSIMQRKSTLANAFASALAPHDDYEEAKVAEAIHDLGQDPTAELECVYCGAEAATWDHVHSRVLNGEFSGYGHRIRNLVPCCRSCNEKKGKNPWRDFLESCNSPVKDVRLLRLERFLCKMDAQQIDIEALQQKCGEELEEFLMVRSQVFELVEKADQLAEKIRKKAST